MHTAILMQSQSFPAGKPISARRNAIEFHATRVPISKFSASSSSFQRGDAHRNSSKLPLGSCEALVGWSLELMLAGKTTHMGGMEELALVKMVSDNTTIKLTHYPHTLSLDTKQNPCSPSPS